MKRYLIIANLILVAGIAYFGVHAGYRLAALPLADGGLAIGAATFAGSGDTAAARPLGAYRVVADRNLFNTRGPAAPRGVADDVTTLSPTALKLTLRGTVSGGSGRAYAVIEDDQERRQHLYRQGDEVGGAVIRRILREKVILRVDGTDEVLAMSERKTGAAQPAPAAPAPAEAASRADSAGRVTLSGAEIKAATGDLSNLAQQATIRPYFVEGKRDGFLLARVQPRSVFSRMGLRTGDVVKRVGGQAVTSVGQALTLYQNLTPGSEVEVLISRQGVDRTFFYSIE